MESSLHPGAGQAQQSERGRRPRFVRFGGYAAGAAAALTAVLVALAVTRGIPWTDGGDSTEAVLTARYERPTVSRDGLIGRAGIRLTELALTGGGGLIDLRYQVVDPDLASAVHDDESPPALISEQNGVLVDELLMGHQHEGGLRGGQTYYLIFSNPGNLVERGSKVTVLLGNAAVRHVPVR